MGRISKRPINPEIEERVFEIFRNYIGHLRQPNEIQSERGKRLAKRKRKLSAL